MTDKKKWLLLGLFWIPVIVTCVWVLSLPVFPSQDGPLHLYYINVFRHLLTHQPGSYADAYFIKTHISPYSSYYYGITMLGKLVSLETADKIMVCTYLLLFAVSTRTFLRVVTPDTQWAPFCVLPVLLNWPLLMGFINYSLSTCLGFFAMAVWCRAAESESVKYRVAFLGLIALMMVTHPVPWLFVTAFAFFDLALRLLRVRLHGGRVRPLLQFRPFRLDLVTSLIALTPYPYLRHFNGIVQSLEPEKPGAPIPLQRFIPQLILPYAQRAQGFIRTLGLDIFAGDSSLARFYRFGIFLLLLSLLGVAAVSFARRHRAGGWKTANTWFVFSVCVFPVLLVLSDSIGNHFFFITRLGILLFAVALAGASAGLQQMRYAGRALAVFSLLWWVLTIGMAVRYISPVARDVASLKLAAMPDDQRPGLLMETAGSTVTPNLNYLPYYWAGVTYFRQHDLLLYNAAWLGDPIIMVGMRPESESKLDGSFYTGLPFFGSRVLPNPQVAAERLRNAGFIVLMRQGASRTEHPLALHAGDTTPAPFANGWQCQHGPKDAWYLCQPSG